MYTKENLINPYVIELAEEFDKAYADKDISKIKLTIETAETNKHNLNEISQAKLFYSLGTSYGDLIELNEMGNNAVNLEKQFFYYQKSIQLIPLLNSKNYELKPYINGLLLPLYTNYANALEKCGRKSKALEYYHLSLAINPNFSMAIGNAGICFYHYATIVSDPIHRDYINYFAYQYLKKAIKLDDKIEVKALNLFRYYLDSYDLEYINERLKTKLNIPQYTYQGIELKYRNWALNNKFYLNPLNDLPVNELCFAADVLHLPNMIVDINAKPVLHGLYNQMKQEFIFARHMLFETIETPTDVHYADKDTYLLQFVDYPQYSIRIEKLKTVFRILYSLFDKVAFFLNDYFKLGIKERDISFRSIWREKKDGKCGYDYKNVLKPNQNYCLNALYWISKEIFDKNEFSINPRAEEFDKLRNYFEHRYVKIYSETFPIRINGEIDDLALYLS